MSGPRLVAEYPDAAAYLAAHEGEVEAGGLVVHGVALPPGTPLSDCTVIVRIAGADAAEVDAKLAAATPGAGVTVVFLRPPAPLVALAARLRAPAVHPAPAAPVSGPHALSLQEKLHLAASCDRELRFQLLRDPNKQLHPMVLRNPRITLEEVHWAAQQPALNPEALKMIAEHLEWGNNAGIAAALVRNPRTPIPAALKLVPRLAVSDLRVLARSQGRAQIVQAAKKILIGR